MKRSFRPVLIVCLILLTKSVSAQSPADTARHGRIDYAKLYVIGGVTAGAFVYGHILQNNLWWKGEKSRFHFDWNYDWKYALGEDKFGHFFFPYLTTNIYSQAFEWAGLSSTRSLIYAASLSLLYETYVEVRDGFSKQWGFSWGDFTADALGASFPVLQHNIPFLRNFNFKISFFPSGRFKAGSNRSIIDDYESTYDWLSINVHNLLPEIVRKYYPSFINIAVGHSVEKLNDFGGGNHRLYIGIDWNLSALPGKGWFWNLLKRNLNFYHFPSPTVQIYPHVIWYGIKF